MAGSSASATLLPLRSGAWEWPDRHAHPLLLDRFFCQVTVHRIYKDWQDSQEKQDLSLFVLLWQRSNLPGLQRGDSSSSSPTMVTISELAAKGVLQGELPSRMRQYATARSSRPTFAAKAWVCMALQLAQGVEISMSPGRRRSAVPLQGFLCQRDRGVCNRTGDPNRPGRPNGPDPTS